MDNLSKNAKVAVGVVALAVGAACTVGLFSQLGNGNASAATNHNNKKKKKNTKKKKSSGSPKSSKKNKSKKGSSTTPTKELSCQIERECIAEFRAYLPSVGKKEQQMYQALQAQGVQVTEEMALKVQEELIADLERHLEEFKKELCKKHNISDAKHDKLVGKLLDDKDPEIMKLMQESQNLWGVFKPGANDVEVPDHIDEDAAISYICRSFKIVMNSLEKARTEFLGADSADSLKTRLAADPKLKEQFNSRFNEIVAAGKQELMKEFGFENEAIVTAMLSKFSSSPKFNRIVGQEKAKMDAYFGTTM